MTYAERLGATHIVDVATLTGAVARALGHLVTGAFGDAAGLLRRGRAAADRGRRALLAAPADRRLRARHGQLVRRPPELGVGRGLARQERPVPARVRDGAVGPPRHRRDGLLPQGHCRSRRAGATGVSHATLVELALAGARRRLTAAHASACDLGDIDDRTARVVAALPRRGRIRARARRGPARDPLAGARRGAPGRPAVDWRTARHARRSGRWRSALLPLRFGGDPLALALFGAWFVTLVVGLATDLDQRLLPDVLTLPVIPIALRLRAQRPEPARRRRIWCWRIAAAVVIPAVLYLPSIPFGAGAFGLGDVKLLVGVGLMVGGERALGGVVVRACSWPGSCSLVLLVDAADRPAHVRPVRAVPHLRGALGGAHPLIRPWTAPSVRRRRSPVIAGTIKSGAVRRDSGRSAGHRGVSCPESRCRPAVSARQDGDPPAGVAVRRAPSPKCRRRPHGVCSHDDVAQ